MLSVLYIDNDRELLEIGRSVLEKSGRFLVYTCDSASEALARLENFYYDAIISENKLPDLDGIEVLRKVRLKYPLLPFLFFSMEAAGDIVIEALNSGADFYLYKKGEIEEQFIKLHHQIDIAVLRSQSIKMGFHLSRLYRILTSMNSASIRIRSKKKLLEETCRIAVQEGGFRMVSISLINKNTGSFEHFTHFSNNCSAIDSINQSGDIILLDAQPVSIALTRGFYYTSIDNRHDQYLAPWREKLISNGFFSSALFPLRTGDEIIGAIIFHAPESQFFSEDEVQLLIELTDNLSLALELMEKEYCINDLTRLSEGLRLTNKKLKLLSEITRHDTMNQLMVVAGCLELTKEHSIDPDSLKHITKAIKAIETIREQIIFTREYQNVGVFAPVWQNLHIVIDAAINEVGADHVEISLNLENIEIFADPMLQKVFYNLFDNSVKHGKTVTSISVTAYESGDCLVVSFEDNGCGIPHQEKENIFIRKYFKNTGYGLFLSKEILSITGILFKEIGKPGKGARFEILVPAKKYRKVSLR